MAAGDKPAFAIKIAMRDDKTKRRGLAAGWKDDRGGYSMRFDKGIHGIVLDDETIVKCSDVWLNFYDNDARAQKGSYVPPYKQQSTPRQQQRQPSNSASSDDDIPF